MEGFGGNQWKIEIDSNMETNPYITLEEVYYEKDLPRELKFENMEKLNDSYIVRLFDKNGFQNSPVIPEYDMIDDPILFHYINSRTSIGFTDFDAVSNHVMNKGLTSKLDIYNMLETLFYRYVKSYECKVEWEKKKCLYIELYRDIDNIG